MSLKDIYETAQFRPILGINKTPRDASLGSAAVNFLSDTYQTGVTNRVRDNKTVTPSTTDDGTTGRFTTPALTYFSTLYSNTALTTFKTKSVHKFNNSSGKKYLDSTKVKDTPGALYYNAATDSAQ